MYIEHNNLVVNVLIFLYTSTARWPPYTTQVGERVPDEYSSRTWFFARGFREVKEYTNMSK